MPSPGGLINLLTRFPRNETLMKELQCEHRIRIGINPTKALCVICGEIFPDHANYGIAFLGGGGDWSQATTVGSK